MPFANSKLFQKFFSTKQDILTNVGYLAFFLPSITDPIIYHLTVRKNNHFSAEQKKTMISQNWSHHSFNLVLEVFSLILSKPIIKAIFKGKPQADLAFYKTVGGFMAMILAKSLIRPFVMIKFAEKEKAKDKKPGEEVVSPNVAQAQKLDVSENIGIMPGQKTYQPLNTSPFNGATAYLSAGTPRLATPIG